MRDVKQLHPFLQHKIGLFLKDCEEKGYKVGISECLRTVKEQDDLYAKGRTIKGNIVTNAKGSTYSSQHQWGVAFDIYRNDGKGAYNDSDNWFRKVTNIAKKRGLETGYDWRSITDKPHIYLPTWGCTTTELKEKYGTPEKFMKTWIAISNYSSTGVKLFKSKTLIGTVLERIPYLQEMDVLYRKKRYAYVNYKGQKGYVKTKWIK